MNRLLFCLLGICLCAITASAQQYQQSIDSALQHVNESKSMEELDKIVEQLRQAPQHQHLLVYWKAYALYKQALAYQALHQEEKSCQKHCAKILSEAIQSLEALSNKNSEDYALLAVLRNLSISYCAKLKIPFISTEAKNNATMAIQTGENNVRAYVAAGILDYFTPSTYGGGQAYEQHFLKALSLEDQQEANPYLPTWGKEEAYFYLIIHYYNRAEFDTAIRLMKEALEAYPQESRLLDLAQQMKQHGRL